MATDDLVDSLTQAAYCRMLTKRDRLFLLVIVSIASFLAGMWVGIWLP